MPNYKTIVLLGKNIVKFENDGIPYKRTDLSPETRATCNAGIR